MTVAATTTPDINVTDTTFQNNSASSHGGAIYVDAGTLNATGWWDFRFNDAGGNGGAVAVYGAADADFNAGSDRTSYLAVNYANGDGGALYVANNDSVALYATSGQLLNLNTNNAGGDGGAAYANNGGFFDVYGQLQATSNIANGNGGVFYLSNGSRVWLDDYATTRPQIWVNTAGNGGAIYASNSPRVECDGADFGLSNNGNKATVGSGGAIYLSGSTLTADNCTFRNNQAQAGNGGAIAAYTSTVSIDTDYPTALTGPIGVADRSEPNAPLAMTCDPLTAQCSALSNNRAISSTVSNGYGGAIYNNAGTLNLSNTYLHHNTAVRGGAVYQDSAGSISNLANTLIYSNTSLLAFGAGIRTTGGSLTVTQVTIANNPGGAGYSQSGTTSRAVNSIAWGNGASGFLGSFAAATCNIDQSNNAGLNANPQFVSAGAGEDYHLSSGSPAIDACVTGLPRDLDNVARPFGSQFDMGAYEYAVAMTLAPNRSGAGFPLGAAVYTHTLTNLGATDSYTVTARSSHGWVVNLNPALNVTLNPSQSAVITAAINIPSGVLSGTVETTIISATSWADPLVSAYVTNTTLIGQVASVALSPDRTGVADADSVSAYQHTLTNTGNGADVFDLTHLSSQGWAVQYPTPIGLAAGQTTTIVISVTVPTGAISGTVDTTIITATSRANTLQFAFVIDMTVSTRVYELYLPLVLK